MICVTSYEDLKKNTNLLLERYACGKLREIVDMLNKDRNATGGNQHHHHKPTVRNPSARALSQGTATNTPPTNGGLSDLYDESGKKLDMCSAKRKSESETTEGLRSGKRFKHTGHTESTRNKLDTFLLDVMALFKRSDVPKSEWPKIQQPNPNTTPLKLRIVDELFKIDSTIVGCGYHHHILQIYLNREANVSLDSALTKALNKHNLVHHNFNYGPCKYTECCGIKVGSHLGTQTVSATLGGFAKANENLYALVSRHFVETVGNDVKHKRPNGDCVTIATHTVKPEGDLDISAARILPKTLITDTRFRDSIGRFTSSMLFNFEGQVDDLQSEYIFAWTANSVSRPSRGMITIPDFQRPSYQHNYVVIESEQDECADQGAVGPPVTESFGKRGDSGAIVCFDDKDGNGVHVVSMFMGELRFGDTHGLVSLPLQQGLQQINAKLGGENLQLC
ncbi:uncharacterized protein LOC127835232 [Dreissena polymorpha]|nr:uncharacterized protein LOC127835232 [Dreissena polymorpha]